MNESSPATDIFVEAKKIDFNIIEFNVTTSCARKIPLEQYGSVDFFASNSARVSVTSDKEISVEEALEAFDDTRKTIVAKSFKDSMKDVSFRILVTRAVREGMSATEAIKNAQATLGSLEGVVETIAEGK
jgi:hypothetical protein